MSSPQQPQATLPSEAAFNMAKVIVDWQMQQKYQGQDILHAIVCCDHVSHSRFINEVARIIDSQLFNIRTENEGLQQRLKVCEEASALFEKNSAACSEEFELRLQAEKLLNKAAELLRTTLCCYDYSPTGKCDHCKRRLAFLAQELAKHPAALLQTKE